MLQSPAELIINPQTPPSMASSMDAPFLLAWACLLVAPPVAFGGFHFMRRRKPKAVPLVAKSALALVVMVMGMRLLGVSFKSTLSNVTCLSAAYCAYCFLAASCRTLRVPLVRIPALVVTGLPIGMGYLLGTFGFLGLAFVVDDYTNPPLQTTAMQDDLDCRVTAWGMAGTDSGYQVRLYKRWPGVPFVEREVASLSVNQTNSDSSPNGATCSDALAVIR